MRRFSQVQVNDWLREDNEGNPIPFVQGQTIGCGCCSTQREITAKELLEEIEGMKEELKQARLLYNEYFGGKQNG